MSQEVFWMALLVILIFGCMILAAAVLLLSQPREAAQDRNSGAWRLELWNIQRGHCIQLRFVNTCLLGRLNVIPQNTGTYPPEYDPTISREHCLLYDQDGMLLAWNLSAVNPTIINGYRLMEPHRILPGDRMELGNSVFLITSVDRE